MNLSDILQKLAPWVSENGFCRHSLAELAQPLQLTRGAFCYYFSAEKNGIKGDMARQLVIYTRGLRARHLVYPIRSFQGSLFEKRIFFARQMAHYLQGFHRHLKLSTWSCPAYALEQEVKHMGEWPADGEYHQILEDLFRGPGEYLILNLKGPHLEKMISGPYPNSTAGVLEFFKAQDYAALPGG